MFILLDDVSNKTLGISLVSRPEIPSAEQIVEYIEVDGRHGSLTKKGSYKNITIPMEFSFMGIQKTVKQMLREVKGWVLNKENLVFSDDPNFYYEVKNIVVNSTVNDVDIYGRVAIDFVCSPFQYQITTPITLNEAAVLVNSGTIEAEPLIKVFGLGDVTVTVNGQMFKLNGMADYISVDCELKEAHRNKTSRNSNMVGEFPVFIPGQNTISFSSNVTKLVIEPRWRYI